MNSNLALANYNESKVCNVYPFISRMDKIMWNKKCHIIFEDSDLELYLVEKRKKEILVKKVHKNKISEPSGANKRFRTRVKDETVGRLTAKTYDELIDKLYNYYYTGSVIIPTFEEAVYAWINSREESHIIEHNTADHYRNEYEKYIKPFSISSKPITEIKKSQLVDMFERIIGDGSKVKKSTVRNIKTVVNGAFRYANMKDGVDCIDAERIDIRDMKRKCQETDNSDNVYSEDEILTLLAYLNGLETQNVYSLAIRFHCCTTARISEIRAITWDDIDFDNRILHLRHSIVDKKVDGVNRKATDVDYMKAHSTKGKRDIKLSNYAMSILEELKQINGDKKYIFNSAGEMPITINNYNEHLRKYCDACGIKYRSSHKIRFYNCSKMYEKGVDEKKIQTDMGHSSLSMTRHYDRRKAKPMQEDLVEELFGYDSLEAAKNRSFLKVI